MPFIDLLIEPRNQIPQERKTFSNSFLRQLILPLFIEQLLLMVVGMADTMMVSHAGEATVSGVSLDTMFYTIFIFMFTAVGTGGSVIVSQYIGSKDRKSANTAASQLYFIALVFSVACMAVILVFGNLIIDLLYGSADAEVLAACRVYLRIVALSFPANAVYNAGTALYRSMGRTSVTMKVSIFCTVIFRTCLSIVLGVWLQMGVIGVAIAMVSDWALKALLLVLRYRSGKWKQFRLI